MRGCADAAVLSSRLLSVRGGMLTGEISRHTTFRFCLDPTVEPHDVLAPHAGAARFGFNECLRMVKTALARRHRDPNVEVPSTGFDLINTFTPAGPSSPDYCATSTPGAAGSSWSPTAGTPPASFARHAAPSVPP
jgi:hypothetical protein